MARLSGKTGSVVIGSIVIFDGQSALDEQVISNVTNTFDTTTAKVGSGSAKMAMAAEFGSGYTGSKVITSTSRPSGKLGFHVKS